MSESVKEVTDSNSSPDVNDSKLQSEKIPTYLGFKGKALQWAISVMAGSGFLLFGYDQGVMGSLLLLKSFEKTFPEIDTTKYPNRDTLQGAVVAIYEIGCLFGALSTMLFADKIGRRKTIYIGCVIMIIGAVIQASSYSIAQLIVGRIVTGLGNGMNTATVPVWQSECAKPHTRGKLVMAQGSLISGGLTLSYWIDFAFYFLEHSSVSWRFPIAFQIIFPLIMLPFILKLPESPRWLMKTNQVEEARKVFSSLDNLSINHDFITKQINEISEVLAEETQLGTRSQFKAIFKQGPSRNFHRVMLGVWAQTFQQITGINLISYFAGTIYEKYIGMSPLNSRILAACNGTEYFLFSWVAFYTIERFGRRKLMIFGALGQAGTMAILTGVNWASQFNDNSRAAVAAAVFLFVYNDFFAIGWLGMTWLYPAEITPLNIRAAATGLSTAANWAFNFMVVMITPVAFTNIGPYTYTIFAAINFLIAPAIYFLYPETSGRSLEEMDKIFALSNPWKPWEVVKIARDLPHEHNAKEDDEVIESFEKAHVVHIE